MIVCKYDELPMYKGRLTYLEKGMACIEELRKKGFPTGKYEFEGGFLMVQRGDTKPFTWNAFETHRKWIDVQYIIAGGEKAYYMPLRELKIVVPYDEEKDIAFFSSEHQGTVIDAEPDMVYVAFPEDGHMPIRYKEDRRTPYVKIVMKLPVE